MKRKDVLGFSIVLLAFSACIQSVTGLMFFFQAGSALVSRVHYYNAPVFVILVIMHIVFNRGWFRNNLMGRAS